MENLLGWSYLFGDWSSGTIVTGFAAGTEIPWNTARDIGEAAAVAFTEPGRPDALDGELAGEVLTITRTAELVTEVTGRPVSAPVLTPQEAVERGLLEAMVNGVERINENGSPARPEIARALGLPLTDFRTWARRALA